MYSLIYIFLTIECEFGGSLTTLVTDDALADRVNFPVETDLELS